MKNTGILKCYSFLLPHPHFSGLVKYSTLRRTPSQIFPVIGNLTDLQGFLRCRKLFLKVFFFFFYLGLESSRQKGHSAGESLVSKVFPSSSFTWSSDDTASPYSIMGVDFTWIPCKFVVLICFPLFCLWYYLKEYCLEKCVLCLIPLCPSPERHCSPLKYNSKQCLSFSYLNLWKLFKCNDH